MNFQKHQDIRKPLVFASVLFFIFSYQNCSRVDFRADRLSLLKGGTNNGESYSGKIYTYNDPADLCGNGSAFRSAIQATTDGIFQLIVDRCRRLEPPTILNADLLQLTESDGQLAVVYEGNFYFHQADKPPNGPSSPYPLPTPKFTPEDYDLWRGIYGPANLVYHQVWGLWQPNETGAMLGDSFTSPALIRHGSGTDPSDHVSGIAPGSSLTIEASLRVHPESEDDAIVLEFVDTTGMITVLLSPQKISTVEDTKLSTKSDHAIDLTSAFRKIEILRRCPAPGDSLCLRYDVYVDDVLVHSQSKLGETVVPSSRISIGDLAYPEIAPRIKMELNYLRWHGKVFPR